MAKEETKMYDLSEAPKYIMWERSSRKTIYFEPLIQKHENEFHSDAYIGMYARFYGRGNVTRYRLDDYLFRVEGPTLVETLQAFGERLQQLQKDELIQGRYLCAEKIESKHRTLIHEDVYYKLKNEYYKHLK